jgi:hypothetical protein
MNIATLEGLLLAQYFDYYDFSSDYSNIIDNPIRRHNDIMTFQMDILKQTLLLSLGTWSVSYV